MKFHISLSRSYFYPFFAPLRSDKICSEKLTLIYILHYWCLEKFALSCKKIIYSFTHTRLFVLFRARKKTTIYEQFLYCLNRKCRREKNDGNVKMIFPHKQTKQTIFCEFPSRSQKPG